jgi:glycine amidinotransferase
VNPNEPQTPPTRAVEHAACPVNSFNEWDPLEEVIVGRLEGAVLPGYEPSVTASMPEGITRTLRWIAGWKYPRFVVETAQRQLDNFIHILEAEGVRVRRPDVVPFSRRVKSPFWSSRGYNVANPRDGLLLLGDEILETPMAWRCRYFEMAAYRSLLKEYFAAGARWTAAPRPMLRDDLYDRNFTIPGDGEPIRYAINEFEPVFDAADFIRCGRDIFMTRSNVTNALGLEWLRRHVGDRYRIHQLESKCRQPMHIDSSFMPMAPGKVLVNPEYIDVERLPPMFKSWDVLVAPRPNKLDNFWYKLFGMTSKWIGMNILMLDEERVIVEESQKDMIKAFEDWGFKPIPCSFVHYAFFGGSFHCSTLDVRRRGTLQSYF